MTHVMLDLETLGTSAGAMIVSIGAVEFKPRTGELGDEFYTSIYEAPIPRMRDERPLSYPYGLRADQGTLDWWDKQSEAARAVLTDPEAVPLHAALASFGVWLNGFDTPPLLYGNGADFDLPILGECYIALGKRLPWKPFNGRCYRTLKALAPHIKLHRVGEHHNALDDAKSQAAHLMDIVSQTTLTLA